MHAETFHRFEDAYLAVLAHVSRDHEHRTAARGNAARECLNISFALADPRDRIVHLRGRRTNIVFCYAEALWYLLGRDDLEMISYYAPRLTRYSADGKVLSGTAYGPKLFGLAAGGRSQWDTVVERLRLEEGTKRAVVTFFHPEELADPANPDVSCTLALQFMLRDGRLHAITYMRGNDAVTGLLCDVFSFTVLQEFTARRLGVGLGTYAHHVGSMHINDIDINRVATVLADAALDPPEPPPVMTMPATGWAELAVVACYEEALRHNEAPLDLNDQGWSRLAPYWQQVVLLFEIHRQIRHQGGQPVSRATLSRLAEPYQRLISNRWPKALPLDEPPDGADK
ncbi:thymidylate synthase [Bailinhaonella thermotolerans]|uniref:Thymidylate synthase n=1 Tax=Bailinhaonella thermotolerans TaxID=1070861 RepID=A0A3A4A7Q2_9ACTN|nr:thymidylate synthase [Bailinhaonella thermotolerans]RJL23959.1 thymidylate synthase [Bailinhaonella thermotolerans]